MNCTDSQSAPSCIAPAQNSAEVASSWCGGTYMENSEPPR